MSKDFIPHIEAGSRVGGLISDEAKKKNVLELFDVLEVMADGQLRCHKVGTRFSSDNRSLFLREHLLTWCRLPNGSEFVRKTTEDKWQDAKLLL